MISTKAAFVLLLTCASALAAQVSPHGAAAAHIETLLASMTLEEKVGQMTQLNVGVIAAPGPRQLPGQRVVLDSAKLREAIVTRHVGSVINVLDQALPAEGWRRLVRDIQDVATRETRLRIPVIYGVDHVRGSNYLRGGTVFPQSTGMAATFDPGLVNAEARITAAEMRAAGLPWNFAPVLDVGRQPLFPRFYETFGEDPRLTAQLGAEAVRGLQQSGRVAATMKHYLAYSGPRTGYDRTPIMFTRREVRELFLPPFRAAVQAGVRTVMVNSGEIDGEPVHASRYWLTDVLRGELGFQGVVVTDWADIIFLHTRHRVAPTLRDAVRMAVQAGIDISMTPNDYDFADELVKLVRDSTIPMSRIDASVRRILRLKTELGLFDLPYGDATPTTAVGLPASREVARQAARASITLLKNEGRVLPLTRKTRVLVTGPASNSLTALGGGWMWTWQGTDERPFAAGTPTLLDAIRGRAPGAVHVGARGWKEPTDADIAAAVRAARDVDVAVIAIGENAYAEWVGDIDDLTLSRAQLQLVQAVQATGTPTVLVLVEGRPRTISAIADSARGIVMAYWPGPEGAEALAEVLFGDWNPGGKLPFTYPRYPNQLVAYDHRFTEQLARGFGREPGAFSPQWELGYGLSYTTFAYRDVTLDRATVNRGQRLRVRVTVQNTGTRGGDETVILFTRQHFASLTPSVRRLRAFRKMWLAAGESRSLVFTLSTADLTFLGRDGRPVLEPGAFDVIVGGQTRTFRVTP